MRRRTLMIQAVSFAIICRFSVASMFTSAETAMQRISQAAQMELDEPTLLALQKLSKNITSFTSKAMSEAIAKDFRTGCTVVLGGVLLSQHEVARTLNDYGLSTEIHHG